MMNFMALLFLVVLVSDAEGACDSGWREYNNHCWKVFSSLPLKAEGVSQDDAEAACHKSNAQLASIHAEAENTFVYSLIDASTENNDFWIGLKLTRKAADNKLISAHWNDGSEMSYGDVKQMNAGQGPWGLFSGIDPEPNDLHGSEACVRMSRGKKSSPYKRGWIDAPCIVKGESYPFVCKK